MNMPGFTASWFVEADGVPLWPQWWNLAAETGRDVLFSGKFNSMFSMLFAIGFIIQLERLEARVPERATSIYLRRIFWLYFSASGARAARRRTSRSPSRSFL